MSKGGRSTPTTTTIAQEKLPVELVPFYQDLLGRGVYESLTGYETYPFRRLADFDPYEAGAQEAYAEMALAGTPQSLVEAQEGLREISMGTPYSRAVQSDPVVQRLQDTIGGSVDAQAQRLSDVVPTGEEGVTQTRLEEYMNPFQQAFVDRQKRLAREESDRQQKEIAQQAAVSGNLGGYREGIMQAERQRNLGNQLQDIQATGDLENFRQAQQQFEIDRASRARGADIGLAGFRGLGEDLDRRGRAAEAMANLSGTRQAMEFDRLGQLESAGARRRGLAQQGLDIGYQDFLRQQAFPREQLNLYSGLLRGVPVGPGSYQATYGNQPSSFQQLAGLGVSGLGLLNATRGSAGAFGGGFRGS